MIRFARILVGAWLLLQITANCTTNPSNSFNLTPETPHQLETNVQNGRWDLVISEAQEQLDQLTINNTHLEIELRTQLALASFYLKDGPMLFEQIENLEQKYIYLSDSLSLSFLRFNFLRIYYLIGANKLNLAKVYSDISERLFPKLRTTPFDHIWSLMNKGRLHEKKGEYREAIKLFEEAQKVIEQTNYTNIPLLLHIVHLKGRCYIQLRNYNEAQKCLSKAMALFENHQNIWEYNWIHVYKTLGYTYNMKGQLNQALNLYKKVGKMYDQYPPSAREKGDLYYRMASLMLPLQNHDKAIGYFTQALPLYGNEKKAKASIHHNLAVTYDQIGDISSALHHINQAFSLAQSTLENSNNTFLARIYMNMGRIYANDENWMLAEKNMKQSIDIFSSLIDNDSTLLILPLYFWADLHERQKKWSKAEKIYQRTLEIAIKAYGYEHFRSAVSYAKLAKVAHSQLDYVTSLRNLQQALQCVFPDQPLEEYFENPILTENNAQNHLFSLLKQKADVLREKAKAESSINDLQISLDTYLLAQQWADSVRLKINTENDKLTYLKQVHGFYPAAIATSYQLYYATEDRRYLSHAFYLIEKSKANVLLENLKENEALKFAQIDIDLQEREQALRTQLFQIKQEIEKLKQTNQSIQPSLQSKVFSLQFSYDSLLSTLENNYPAYYQIKYNLDVHTLSEVQQNLVQEDQAILEYYVAEKDLYILYITKDTVMFRCINESIKVSQLVSELREGIMGWHTTSDSLKLATPSLYEQTKFKLHQSAHGLYKTLISPISEIKKLPKRLIIIPDRILGYIPFDLLLKDSVSLQTPYSQYPYLIREHSISYCYSSNLLWEMQEQRHSDTKKRVLGIGLSFTQDYLKEKYHPNTFEPLYHSLGEIKQISKIVKTVSITDAEATEEKIKSLLKDFQVLHFSTHGILNEQESNLSFLALAGANRENEIGRLYVQDLYSLRINAELVVLSACETSLGKYFEGEGIISLARGFSNAGASSLITTLWQVNDQSIASIMSFFYKYLRAGYDKDEALRLAKLEYIENTKDKNRQHPFFWAAEIPIGNMENILIDSPDYPWYIWALCSLIIIGMWGLNKRISPKN